MSDCRNPHLSAYDRAAQEDRERSRAADSREEIEADARELQSRIWQAGAEHDGISLSHIIALLDRQAAITRREVLAQPDERDEQIAELQAKMDELEAELNRTCTLAYDGKWLTCSECGESLQWFGVWTVYKTGTQERALGVEGVRYCPFCGARIEGGDAR